MDVFLAACQGLGLALAGGIVISSALVLARAGRGAATRFLAILIAAAIGAALFALSLETETNSWWWGIVAGALAGAAAARLGGAILAGAAERARETAGTLGAIAAVGAIVLAALSLFISPIALVAAAGLVVLYMGRRRRAARKYEGLRSLR